MMNEFPVIGNSVAVFINLFQCQQDVVPTRAPFHLMFFFSQPFTHNSISPLHGSMSKTGDYWSNSTSKSKVDSISKPKKG